MNTSTISRLEAEPKDARVSADTLSVDLVDGRTISVPLQWFPRLVHGSAAERCRFELTRTGIHWPDLDEDISVAGLLQGRGSGETSKSIEKWLSARTGK
jgi:hypothetical protein